MDMIQKTALKETAKTLAGLTAIAIAVPAVIYIIPVWILGGVVCIGCLGMATKMIYDMKLAQAKCDQALKRVDQ